MVYTFTDEEKAQFEKDGFLIVRQEQHQLFDPKDLYRWAYEVKAWPKVKGKWMVYEEMSTAGKVEPLKTEFFSNWHDDLRQVMREGDLLNVLQQLSGGEMCIFKEKINYKAPGCHGFIAHIDAPSYDDTAKVPHLTCLIAVDPNTKENGCLEVVKGSHKMAHVPDPAEVKASKGWPVSNIDPKWIESHEWTPAVLEPGDILFFGSHIAHRSAANNSNKSRAAIYATYNSVENNGRDNYEAYYARRRDIYPPEYEREDGKDYAFGFKLHASSGGDIPPVSQTIKV